MKNILLIIGLMMPLSVYSQEDTIRKFTFGGYCELYYGYDFSRPANGERPDFIYNHKHHNEISTNLTLLSVSYRDKSYRGDLGLMWGNYAQYNLAHEPDWAKFIYAANVGVRLSKRYDIWVDGGIMPSHIGYESTISADCWTLTRSLSAENSPYYNAGIKMTYTTRDKKLLASVLYLNGWQRIVRLDGLTTPSFGTQVTYQVSDKLLINYSTFFGSDKPDSLKAFRQYHNLYAQYKPTDKLWLILGFDIGHDKYDSVNYGIWFTPNILMRYKVDSQTHVGFRFEYYGDPNQIIVSTDTDNGFKTIGVSMNIDRDFSDKVKFRVEGKTFRSQDKIFNGNDYNYCITTSLSLKI